MWRLVSQILNSDSIFYFFIKNTDYKSEMIFLCKKNSYGKQNLLFGFV